MDENHHEHSFLPQEDSLVLFPVDLREESLDLLGLPDFSLLNGLGALGVSR